MPLSDTLRLPRFVHPRATREAVLGHARVAYEFTRGKRRTIGFVVGAEGLSVRAPRWVALRDVDAALQEKADWILRKLDEAQQRHARLRSRAHRMEGRRRISFPGRAGHGARSTRAMPSTGVGGMLDAEPDEWRRGPALRLARGEECRPRRRSAMPRRPG